VPLALARAQALFVSGNTVEKRLSDGYRKLAISSRAEPRGRSRRRKR
jgi:DNA-binding CsgD family transcriptional regulator